MHCYHHSSPPRSISSLPGSHTGEAGSSSTDRLSAADEAVRRDQKPEREPDDVDGGALVPPDAERASHKTNVENRRDEEKHVQVSSALVPVPVGVLCQLAVNDPRVRMRKNNSGVGIQSRGTRRSSQHAIHKHAGRPRRAQSWPSTRK